MHAKSKRKVLLFILTQLIYASKIFCQESFESEDLMNDVEREFSLSMYSLKELFNQQNDGGMDLGGLILIALGVVAAIGACFGLFYLILFLIRKKRRTLLKTRFLAVKKMVNKTKMESTSASEMQKTVEKGIKVARQVDRHTGRHNSIILPLFVYRIAVQLNLGERISAIYFCVSLFYDSGFLEIPQELFFGEILTKKEKSAFRKHVINIEKATGLVPQEMYRECFNACSFHHENFDGSGYPEGLVGDEIPLVARIIRVVESYLSLISRGTYHRGLTKGTAIRDLRKRGGWYDPRIIDILETLI